MTNICPRFCFIFSCATLFACAAISSNLFAAASNQYCDNEVNRHHIGLSTGKLQSTALDSGTDVALTRNELSSGVLVSNKQNHAVAIDFNFQYTIVNFDDTISPMTNGHLHTWNFPISWRSKGTDYTLDYSLAPVISVSSNVLKNPDLLDRKAMQLWAALIYKKHLNKKSAWLLGFRSDHRFGPYRIYPVVGLCWQANANWQLQLALPDFSFRRFFSNGINIKLFAEPDGRKWHVFSKDTTSHSDFIYKAIVTGLSIEWRINTTVWLEFSAVKHSGREFSFTLDDGTLVETGAKSSTGLAVAAGILF